MGEIETFSWTCPFCNRPVTITDEDVCADSTNQTIESSDGYAIADSTFIVCPNPDCKRFSLRVTIYKANKSKYGIFREGEPTSWQLIPRSTAQSFPDYIPRPLLNDYEEACLIKDLSPKASATLARRCLQGIIRDFWQGKVKPGKLGREIEQIEDLVDVATWQAIDAVRSVGNIGAHMENDVNIVVDIDANEADLLISLIEILFKDWYIARHDKTARLTAIVALGKTKDSERKSKPNAPEQSS